MTTGLNNESNTRARSDALNAMAHQSRRSVISGCVVTPNGSQPPLKVDVASGSVLFSGTEVSVGNQTVALTTAHATLDRYDVIVVNSSGIASAVAGTPAADPVTPDVNMDNYVIIARVLVGAGGTVIGSGDLKDIRIFFENAVGSFLGLTDTPSSYSGQGGKIARVNTGETGIEFHDPGYGYIEIREAAGLDVQEPLGDVSSGGPAIKFDPDTNQSILYAFRVPEDCDPSQDMELELTHCLDGAGGGNVRVKHTAYIAQNGEDKAVDTQVTGETLTPYSTADRISVVQSTTLKIPAASLDAGALIRVILQRDASNVLDTATANYDLFMVRYRYTKL